MASDFADSAGAEDSVHREGPVASADLAAGRIVDLEDLVREDLEEILGREEDTSLEVEVHQTACHSRAQHQARQGTHVDPQEERSGTAAVGTRQKENTKVEEGHEIVDSVAVGAAVVDADAVGSAVFAVGDE